MKLYEHVYQLKVTHDEGHVIQLALNCAIFEGFDETVVMDFHKTLIDALSEALEEGPGPVHCILTIERLT